MPSEFLSVLELTTVRKCEVGVKINKKKKTDGNFMFLAKNNFRLA